VISKDTQLIWETYISQWVIDNEKPYTSIESERIGGGQWDTEIAWCKKGTKFKVFHRVDKDPETGLTLPALISRYGPMSWYVDGKLHREDGPAYMKHIGKGHMVDKAWFLNGKCVTEQQVIEYKKKKDIIKQFNAIPSNRFDPKDMEVFLDL
jgi:membrane carboxypeptidase/penicillin-binding protein PbpC